LSHITLYSCLKFSFHQQDKGKLAGRYHNIEVVTLNALFGRKKKTV